jgi:hypothetical protein
MSAFVLKKEYPELYGELSKSDRWREIEEPVKRIDELAAKISISEPK